MALYIRMALYFASAMLAGQGIAVFDPEAGTLIVDLKSAETALAGVGAFVGTFVVGRIAKARGGAS